MEAFILTLLMTAPPVELHTTPTRAGTHLRQCITHDFPVVCEDTRAINHYQHELRRVVVFRTALDDFVQIGRQCSRFPAYRHPAMVVLFVKREIDTFNGPARVYAETVGDFEHAKFAGLVSLGSAEYADNVLPMPWEDGYQLTEWKPPEFDQ